MNDLPVIPFLNLLVGFVPVALVLVVMHRWSLDAVGGLYASLRMLVQLLAVGYVLTYIFEADNPLVIAVVIVIMISVSAWIALRPLAKRSGSAPSSPTGRSSFTPTPNEFGRS